MGKPNTYVQLLNAQKEIARLSRELIIMKNFTIQQCIDVAEITNNEEFSFGSKRNRQWEDAFSRNLSEMIRMCVADGDDDPEIIYTKEKLDRRLRVARGEDTPDFDARYDLEYLCRWSRDKVVQDG